MLEYGFLKLYRSILNWEWYKDSNTKNVFIHLILKANYEDGKWRGQDVLRGQCITSITNLSSETGVSFQSVRTALKHLKSTGEITSKGTEKNTVITIKNYDKYQSLTSNLTDEQQTTNMQLTCNQHATNMQTNNKERSKESKESKKARRQEEKDIIARESKVQFAEFVSMTNAEYEALIAKLGEHGAKRCIMILDNYKGSSGKKYKSDYRAILSWVMDKFKQETNSEKQQPQQFKTAYERTLDTARKSIEKYKNGEMDFIDI